MKSSRFGINLLPLAALGLLPITADCAGDAPAAGLTLYSGPAGVAPSPHYSLTVNGHPAFVYEVKVNPTSDYRDVAAPAAMAYFDFGGEATVEIAAHEPVSAAAVRPLSRRVTAAVFVNKVRFTLTEPGSFVVTFNDGWSKPFFLFANPPEKDAPGPADPGVVYFGPGVHSPGQIDLKSGQTLYLAGGALVKGVVRAADAENIAIRGRGILYGGEIKRNPGSVKLAVIDNCRSVRVEDIIALDAAGWFFNPIRSNHVTFDNVKILGWRRNTDGIDPVSCQNVLVKDCFIKGQDDGVSIKGNNGPVRNTTVTGCVMWQNFMRSFVLGGEMHQVETIENIVFRDSDVLFSGYNPNHDRDAALSVWNVDAATMRGVVFENIRVEKCTRLVRIGIVKNKHSRDKEFGHVRGVVFRNITAREGKALIEITGHNAEHRVEDVLFENVRIHGNPVESPDPRFYIANPFVRNIAFRAVPAR